jgi:hypothetical protein
VIEGANDLLGLSVEGTVMPAATSSPASVFLPGKKQPVAGGSAERDAAADGGDNAGLS